MLAFRYKWVIIVHALELGSKVEMLTMAPDTVPPIPAPVRRQVLTVVSELVHDLRQPLSVIEACADYMDLVLPEDDRRTRQQLELLRQQVSDANRIMHEALVKLHYGDASADVCSTG